MAIQRGSVYLTNTPDKSNLPADRPVNLSGGVSSSPSFGASYAPQPSASLPSAGAAYSASVAGFRVRPLLGRAFDRSVGAEHAAIALLGAQHRFAPAAFVEELAGVRGHGFRLGESAARTGQNGFGSYVHGAGG